MVFWKRTDQLVWGFFVRSPAKCHSLERHAGEDSKSLSQDVLANGRETFVIPTPNG